MRIKIFRGKNQIGGNIIEVASSNTKILLDIGMDLVVENNKKLPSIEGLFDSKGYDAVFISHYHTDHMGLVYNVHKDIPIYIGETSYKIVCASNRFRNKETIPAASFLKHRETITVGDMKITPYLCDHSAYDSYMLYIECSGESILYTGDFRSNGRKKKLKFEYLPHNIDYLICEGTTLSREGYEAVDEEELERKATKLFKKIQGPIFILQSSMNIDRIVTMYKAAKRNGRLFLQELYMAEITNAIGGNIPNPKNFKDVKVFVSKVYEDYRYGLFNAYENKKTKKEYIAKSKFVMCIRTSMYNYINSLCQTMNYPKGLLVYSFWSGYKLQEGMQSFLENCQALGLEIVALHTSGHADAKTIKNLLLHTKPKCVMPVHTENAEWFEKVKKELKMEYETVN